MKKEINKKYRGVLRRDIEADRQKDRDKETRTKVNRNRCRVC